VTYYVGVFVGPQHEADGETARVGVGGGVGDVGEAGGVAEADEEGCAGRGEMRCAGESAGHRAGCECSAEEDAFGVCWAESGMGSENALELGDDISTCLDEDFV